MAGVRAEARTVEARIAGIVRDLDPWGFIGAAILSTLGLTPSLLPRDWLYQGLVSGLAAGVGYVVGIGVKLLWHRFIVSKWADKYPWLAASAWESKRYRLFARFASCAFIVWLVGFVIIAVRWQHRLANVFSVPAPSMPSYLLVVPLALAVFTVFLLILRSVIFLVGWLARRFPQRFRSTYRRLGAVSIVAVIVIYTVENIIPGAIVGLGDRVFTAQNADPDPDVQRPTLSERSGSPTSDVDWDGVGLQGSRFLSSGAHKEELEQVTGRPAKEPIRAYAGLGNRDTNEERAQLLIDELERTHAQDRKALLLTMTTGTGWVSSYSAQAFELLYGGDTAIAAAQYSAMPSVFHFLGGGSQVERAGEEFINPIVDWWNSLPDDDRPKLYLYGESLGTTGIEAAFSGVRDIANSVDGILLTGPPHFNRLRSQFVERRDPGSTEISPVYAGSLVVRFANEVDQVRRWGRVSEEEWGRTRMLYIQHPSDPVSWWSTELAFKEPDWMKEDSHYSRQRVMQWMPIITYLQVAADLPGAKDVPDGVGHNYGTSVLDGFAAIAGPDVARSIDLEELQRQFDTLDVGIY
ncbi:alpha/beta hydrolase [Corynebacterium macginleyi]|uniref:alpha/beta hydrolase n=1 Tax=Corynebacterium macginleyi TaxID=38290 RepID=UPI000EF9989A|nr:alpha/beta hydrolase [Corynebacterium macginleyi]QRJ59444.1 alpha/beta hydrolase [Corynebacterium macginleyi]RMB66749.1 hypothetical protein D9542_07870 [Corynebacterium macginleyi]